MKLDILAFGAHPDDIELGCGGTLIHEIKKGKKVGLIDLTLGELGTRGTVEIRLEEAQNAAKIMGATVRENLGFKDGFFVNDETNRAQIIHIIRKYRPEIVICNAPHDRHPDHCRASEIVVEASFYAGLRKIETFEDGELQEAWRPKALYHYIQFYDLKPDFVVDISAEMTLKSESILAHKSQFYDPNSSEPATMIASPEFLDYTKNRAQVLGMSIGVQFAEGFITERTIGLKSISDLI